ncbi:hypothetical protein LWI29_009838 [Acer saccharum]|uniref:Uncharacterized protein n=1 Tax=Acer saccharum TaxID=4024 RepID=A0AA39T8V5_ACESA|nr:hypothetical protein LWI29_009838 [Acer saccharum]
MMQTDTMQLPLPIGTDVTAPAQPSSSTAAVPTLQQPWSPTSSPLPTATTATTPVAESTSHAITNMSQPMNDHPMQTRAKDNLRVVIHRNSQVAFHAFFDADWAGNKDDFSSTSAYIVYLGWNPILWSSKKQNTIARSTMEAEYRSVAATYAELNWVCFLLTDLGLTLPSAPVIYCDNVGATQLCSNPIFHSCIKHVAIDFHFIRDQVQSGSLRVAHVSSSDQLADALTKPLSRPLFQSLKTKIGLSHHGLS